ncbi:MAG TPA: hypothetical protein VFC82_07180 [Actinomycetaceae bacterium]|nr:hypothetical protein [Actinomycetaceae bacterium]
MLLEYAIASERLLDPEYHEDSFSAGVFLASYHLDPGKGTSVQLIGYANTEPANVAPAEVVQRLASVPLAEVTPGLLRDCLAEAVDSARYWQEPDGNDVLAATDELQAQLHRIAEHVAASAHAAWWSAPIAERSQWQVEWDDASPHEVAVDPLTLLRRARDQVIEEELVARRERPSDVTANWSGTWWSRPPWELPSTTRALFDRSPAGLWFVEDSLGWEQADTRRLGIPTGLHVYEIDTAQAWADLCVRFPIEDTAQKRHDWYRTTGRDGAWVIPDWAKVAEHYDAVHLQVQAYLSAAGTAIPVDEHTATVIAGWNPDQTYWFTPNLRYIDDPVRWTLHEHGERTDWVRQDNPE